jgi:membrane protein implicated in regulation of membrane protease activity
MFEWWHWVVIGLCLAMAELAVPAFFMIWIGIAAVGVGAVLAFVPELGFAAQLLIWAALSALLVVVWFKYLKPATVSAVGTSAAHAIGEVGILVSDLSPDRRGHVRFQKPILGADVWECYADSEIRSGERVRIVAVEGNFIKVESAK